MKRVTDSEEVEIRMVSVRQRVLLQIHNHMTSLPLFLSFFFVIRPVCTPPSLAVCLFSSF